MEEFYITIWLYYENKLSGTVKSFTDVSVWCHTSQSQRKGVELFDGWSWFACKCDYICVSQSQES